jgi:hypothetical protein
MAAPLRERTFCEAAVAVKRGAAAGNVRRTAMQSRTSPL